MLHLQKTRDAVMMSLHIISVIPSIKIVTANICFLTLCDTVCLEVSSPNFNIFLYYYSVILY